MTRLDMLLDLIRHMEWADASVWKAVLAHPAGAADGRVLNLFYHLHVTQWAFLRVWRGEPRETPYPEFTAAAPMAAWGKSWHPPAHAYLRALDESALSPPLHVPWSAMVAKKIGRPAGDTSLGDTILQVAMHSQYHRGQVNARLKETGGAPPLADYIAWLWLGRPAAEWPV
jgi:uncharacterized damage-inducible protein DinB